MPLLVSLRGLVRCGFVIISLAPFLRGCAVLRRIFSRRSVCSAGGVAVAPRVLCTFPRHLMRRRWRRRWSRCNIAAAGGGSRRAAVCFRCCSFLCLPVSVSLNVHRGRRDFSGAGRVAIFGRLVIICLDTILTYYLNNSKCNFALFFNELRRSQSFYYRAFSTFSRSQKTPNLQINRNETVVRRGGTFFPVNPLKNPRHHITFLSLPLFALVP